MRHLDGKSRQQGNLLPDTLDDYVGEDHPVRVIDAFIDSLDLVHLGFSKATTKSTGRKPYNPPDLLKLYVYGYLNQVRSSRRLEKECHRNLEAEGIQLEDAESAMDEAGTNQYCATEPEARLMRSGREGPILGYNVQAAVDELEVVADAGYSNGEQLANC